MACKCPPPDSVADLFLRCDFRLSAVPKRRLSYLTLDWVLLDSHLKRC